ncbi:MAG: hypothetical protein LAN70_01195 [Acidobacteriia bacterium]|nr:hypothetical protein [Terriglobia bacterium]
MKRVILSGAVVFLILAVLAGCGGSSSSSTSTSTVVLSISPTSASVTTGLTQQFTVTVTNTTNTALSWSVNGIVGGNSTVGFISSTGLYTAPNSVPTPNPVTVTATSQADTSVTISVQVTIVAPATPAAPLVVAPQTVTVPAGGQQTFSATVSGIPIAVNWTLNCQSAVAGACGTITTAGVYTAPPSPPPGANVTVTATAQDNSVPPAGAVITVQFSNGTLNGKYAFTFSGQNAGASYVAAGSISFDGNGNITAGTEDINSGGASAVTITSGTYHIGTDGRGNANVVTSGGTVNWQFAVVNHARVFVERFDSGVQSASGTMELQDASQFTLAGVTGNYAFNLSGANGTNRPGSLAMAGAFAANGGIISSGALDVNNAGSPSAGLSLAGTYAAPNASGRGTMTLNSAFGTQNLAYYVVDATHIKVVETDAGAQLVGDVYKQPVGPFTNASVRGGFVFALLGSTSAGAFGEGGVLTLDGTGNVTSATSTIDINAHGNPQNSLAVSGTYNVADATTGRTTANLTVGGSTYLYALYPQTNGALSMVEIDTSNVVAGRALAQALGPFSGGSFQGNYAFNFTGNDFVVNPGEEDLVGQMLPNGGSAITGSVDISDNGVLTHSAALSASYSVTASGHGAIPSLTTTPNAFSNATFNMYIADSGDALFLESDSTRVLVGIAQKQY